MRPWSYRWRLLRFPIRRNFPEKQRGASNESTKFLSACLQLWQSGLLLLDAADLRLNVRKLASQGRIFLPERMLKIGEAHSQAIANRLPCRTALRWCSCYIMPEGWMPDEDSNLD